MIAELPNLVIAELRFSDHDDADFNSAVPQFRSSAVPQFGGGCSSAGRAPGLQPGGHRFDPGQLHQLAGYEP
jgi:hypothetical protein